MKLLKRCIIAIAVVLCCTATFVLCTQKGDDSKNATIARIQERGVLLVGTTGDYRPLSFREESGEYWGFCIEVAEKIAARLKVGISYVSTSWPTLTADVIADPQTFDLAIGGITITDARKQVMLMSDGYLSNGKTILCRATDVDRYKTLEDLNKPEVRVMVNPGGLNEKFANDYLVNATIIVHPVNEEIPSMVASGEADVMITEITEAPWYVKNDTRLAAPLLSNPFTHGEIGVLMRKGQDDLLKLVNEDIAELKSDGTLRTLCDKYGLVYQDDKMRIQVSDGSQAIVFELNDTPVAKSLYDQLPITVDVENYSNNEKIFYPPTALSVTGGWEGDCPVGTLAYFSPWKNVVMYYGAASRYSGLYLLGSAIEGKDRIRDLSGKITVSKL